MRTIIYLLGFTLIGISLWTYRFFGDVTLDQALWTIRFGMQGVLAADSVYIRRFITWGFIWPIIFTFIFLTFEWLSSHVYPKKKISSLLSFFILAAGLVYFSYQYNVLQSIRHSYKPAQDYFALNFTDANKLSFKVRQPKSLVLIYVESLEASYANASIFGRDLLQQLTHLPQQQLVFSQFRQVTGTGWTMGGLVATQCAIPLKSLTIMGNNRVGENIQYFLPNVKCLGDILAEQGYKNVFMGGASLLIGGKGKFFENHHYAERIGLDDWLKQGYRASDMNQWGLPDDELLKQAKIKFHELMKSKQPFNLTILTVDTHGVAGQLSPTCKASGYHDFKGIVECTSNLVAQFINDLIREGALDRVNILVMGDHLAMSNDLNDQLRMVPDHTIFNLLISSQHFQKSSDEIVHFDWLPTILDTLGFQYQTSKLGLGYSAIAKNVFPKNRHTELEAQLDYDSEFYNQLWIPR
jgi:phosphoglycerol transferase